MIRIQPYQRKPAPTESDADCWNVFTSGRGQSCESENTQWFTLSKSSLGESDVVLYLLDSVVWTKLSQSLLAASASACVWYSSYMVIANRSVAPLHCIPGRASLAILSGHGDAHCGAKKLGFFLALKPLADIRAMSSLEGATSFKGASVLREASADIWLIQLTFIVLTQHPSVWRGEQ